MPAIGITGGISTGKSTLCGCLRQLVPGATFFNADQAARQLTEADPEVKKEIVSEFGPEIYSTAGHLNRGRLRGIILEHASKKSALEQILHPRIRRQWSAEAQKHHHSSDFFFADIPLLYETGGETLCDRVVVVACSPDVQLTRLRARAPVEGRAPASPASASEELRAPLPERTAQQMIMSQLPLKEKIARADHVVWNNGEREVLEVQARMLTRLWQQQATGA